MYVYFSTEGRRSVRRMNVKKEECKMGVYNGWSEAIWGLDEGFVDSDRYMYKLCMALLDFVGYDVYTRIGRGQLSLSDQETFHIIM